MPRGKLGMKLIENSKKRRATYKNRRDGLVQKASQLATLCGVESLLVCFDAGPGQDGDGGGGGVAAAATTWPTDREEVQKLINKYRDTPADKIRHCFTAATYHKEELAKQQRKLLKIVQCGPDILNLQDCRLADLSQTDLSAMLDALDGALRKAQQRIVELGGHVVLEEDDVPSAATAMVTAPTPDTVPMPPLAADYKSFDLMFGMPDAGSMVTQGYYPPHDHDVLPQSVAIQPSCLAFRMPRPSYTYQYQTPPPTLITPLDFPSFGTNLANAYSTTAPGLYDDCMPGFDAIGGGVYVDDYVAAGGQDFTAVSAAAAADYQHQYHIIPTGVWPVNRLNNSPGPMDDAAAFQLRNDFTWLPGSSSSSTSFQGGFQKK